MNRNKPELMNLDRCRSLMRQQGLDLLVPSTEEHIYYTSDFPVFQYTFEPETVAFSLIPADSSLEPYLLIPHFTRLTLTQCPTWMPNVGFFGRDYYISGAPDIPGFRTDTVYQAFRRAVSELGLTKGRIGIEIDRLSVEAYHKLKEALPDAEFVDGREVLRNTRSIKTPEEILRLRKAAAAVDRALPAALALAKPGMTELELDTQIRRLLLDEGCTTHYIQLGTGTRGAFGPVYPSDTPIRKGDVVRIDASAKYKHYLSDICRMAVIGEPTEEMRQVYHAVFAAESEALRAVKPGMKVSDLFEIVVRVPGKHGVSDFKRNNIGHAIGLIAHEHPNLTPESRCVIEAGMVLCIEAPYYRWQVGGFAPEDEVLVTDNGCELLTTPQTELIVV